MKQLLIASAAWMTLAAPSFAGYGFYPTKAQKAQKTWVLRAKQAAADVLQDDSLAAPSNLLYYGGPVINKVRVYAVFWGQSIAPSFQKDLAGFYAAAANSSLLDWMNQYATHLKAVDGRDGTRQNITRGSFGGAFVIAPKNTRKDLNDGDLHVEIENQVAAGVLPKPNADTVYMIHFPADVSISIEDHKSCETFCAYHNGFNSAQYGPTFYSVMPDLNAGACSFGCGGGFNGTTEVSSHELTEAVTDPFPTPGDKPAYPQAWNTHDGQEIADLCTFGSADLRTPTRTYKLSKIWDNASRSCYGGPFQSSGEPIAVTSR